MIKVPSFAYKFADSDEVEGLEKFANALTEGLSPEEGHTKVALFGMDPNSPWVNTLQQGAAITAGALGVNLLGMAAGQGARAAHNRLTYRRDLNKVLDVHPDLKDYSKKDIDLAYSSIRTMNPTFAKDPLVGGNLLGQVLRNRDIHDPSKAPRFELGVAKELLTAERKGKDQLQETIQGSFRTGYELAVNDAMGQARERRMELQRQTQDAAKYEADIAKETRVHAYDEDREQRQRTERRNDAIDMMALKDRMSRGSQRKSRRGMSQAVGFPGTGPTLYAGGGPSTGGRGFSSRRRDPSEPGSGSRRVGPDLPGPNQPLYRQMADAAVTPRRSGGGVTRNTPRKKRGKK